MAVGVVGVVLEPQRELPAHLGLPVERSLAGLERRGVQRAADAALEAGAVQEDAGAVDEAGLDLAGLVDLGGPGLAVPDVVELPLLRGEPLGVARASFASSSSSTKWAP